MAFSKEASILLCVCSSLYFFLRYRERKKGRLRIHVTVYVVRQEEVEQTNRSRPSTSPAMPPHRKPRSAGFCDVIAALLKSRFSSHLFTCLFLLLCIIALYVTSSSKPWPAINIYMKIVLGDNLQPTPWHPFPHSPPKHSWRRRMHIFLCSYLICLDLKNINPSSHQLYANESNACPDFFQWIHEDLTPWRRSKISQSTLEAAKEHAAFRVVIVGGRLYTESYYACVQSRALFTLWGFLQLLQKYPGLVPDVDLMFDCMDRPRLMKRHYRKQWPPPPLFRYCGNKDAFDIPFPDWSFWGWAETGLSPWNEELDNILKGSKKIEWKHRHPFAFWKGNPFVSSPLRENLLKCNSSEAQILIQDWNAEASKGYKNSKLSDQCKHRYKIYAEGHAWSVSFKYILSCNSPVLVPSLRYYDFFTRGLLPQKHYWPLQHNRLCASIKFAVNWGNKHPSEANDIGKLGQNFIARNLKMDYVYDYMLHLLVEYAKLQVFQPTVPDGAEELCTSGILCLVDASIKALLKRSSVKASKTYPCSMPYSNHSFVLDHTEKQWNRTKEVWLLENVQRKKRENQ